MAGKLPLLNRLLPATRVVAIDIGARGGFTDDLSAIAAAVEGIGFEPDQEECERLKARAGVSSSGLRSLRYVPVAVGAAAGERLLNLYRLRGCSSLLAADLALAATFAREDYFLLDGQVSLKVERLDDAAVRLGFPDAHFLKIDIQGAELEALLSAPRLVSESLLAIRTEVEFAPLYRDQPLFADVDAELRSKGFLLARFVELHAWRRGTKTRGDYRAPGPVPLSEGQLIHGDALYFRRPETMPADGSAAQDRLICLSLLAFAYGHVDLCASIIALPQVSARILEVSSLAAEQLVREMGAWHASRRRRQIRHAVLRQCRDVI